MRMTIKRKYLAEFNEYVESNLSSFKWIENPVFVEHEIFSGVVILNFDVDMNDKLKLLEEFVKPMNEKESKKLERYSKILRYLILPSVVILYLIIFMLFFSIS